MKRIFLVVLLSSIALAQQPAPPAAGASQVAETNITAKVQAPTYSDVNCAGFITDQPVPKDKYVAAGWSTPHQTKFADRDYVYLSGGGFQEGQRYSIVRQIKDPNVEHYFDDQSRLIGDSGKPYADLGRVLVIGVHNSNVAITQVEFACDAIVPGDVAVPFAAREVPSLRGATRFDRFAPPNGKLTGRIVMAKDFDSEVGAGGKVYLNVGSGQGVKVGDYFRVTRTYPDVKRERTDSLSYKIYQMEDTQASPASFPYSRVGELPRMSLGEMVILNVSPKSATGMITFSLEDIVVGDGVEMEEPPPPAPPAAAAMNPPTISCSANPASIRVGETSTITCDASSPDNRPLQYQFASNGGSMTQRENVGTLTSNQPGSISVKATATDDRNLSAAALTTVNVEAPPAAPTAAKTNEIAFKNNSAYVDNRAKAVLDDVALRLQQDPNSTVTLIGMSDPKEPKRLADRRAVNAAAYLSKSKGIDPGRIHTKAGTEGGKKADIWMVPAGAQAP